MPCVIGEQNIASQLNENIVQQKNSLAVFLYTRIVYSKIFISPKLQFMTVSYICISKPNFL